MDYMSIHRRETRSINISTVDRVPSSLHWVADLKWVAVGYTSGQ